MASDLSFVEYLLGQLHALDALSYKKMFGDFALYHQGKVVGFVCDNQLFIKPTDAGQQVLGRVVCGLPYPRAKPHFLVTDVLDDHQTLARLVLATSAALPLPKPKPPKAKREQAADGAVGAGGAIAAAGGAVKSWANLGPKSLAVLQAIGVTDLRQLKLLGSVAVYAQAKRADPKVSLNLLWALEGALSGLDWRVVARTRRASLLLALEDHELRQM